MSFSFNRKETAAAGVRRIASEQLQEALAEIQDQSLDRHEVVHQVRKRCKKLRGLLRLVRPCLGKSYKDENAWFRDSARALSDIRDAQALVESSEALLKNFPRTFPADTFAELEQRLVLHRDTSAAEKSDVEARLTTFAQRMRQAEGRLADWPLEKEGFDLLLDGLEKTYGRGRKAYRAAYQEPSAEAFHEWRKRMKYHWYHTRLLEPSWPTVMSCRAGELKQLSDYLGDDHDLVVLQQTLQEKPDQFGPPEMVEAFCGLARQRQTQLRSAARLLGARVYAEKTQQHGRRVASYWKAWQRYGKNSLPCG